MKKAKLIFNVADLWPESAQKLGLIRNKLILKISGSLEEYVYRKSDLITCQANGILSNIRNRIPDKPYFWFKNGVDLDFYSSDFVNSNWRSRNGYLKEDFVCLYAGNIGYAQGIEIIPEVAKILKPYHNIKFVIIGDGPEKDKVVKLHQSYRLKNVIILPSVPKNNMPEIIFSADCTIIPLKKKDLFKGVIPSKIVESLAMSKPVLLGLEGEACELFIEQGNCGLAFKPENIDDLADKILKLYEHSELYKKLCENCRPFVTKYFDRSRISSDLLDFIRKYG